MAGQNRLMSGYLTVRLVVLCFVKIYFGTCQTVVYSAVNISRFFNKITHDVYILNR